MGGRTLHLCCNRRQKSYDGGVSPHFETVRLTTAVHDLDRAAAILRVGGLVAMPTETVYGLAANAMDTAAVERIFAAKQRPHWDPLIVHVADEAMLQDVVTAVPPVARRLMDACWPGALTLLLPRQTTLPDAVTAGRELVAVRMPAHPVALALIRAACVPLAAPSANRFGHVSPTSAAHVLADLDGRIDAVIDAGACAVGVESTVVEARSDEIILYRAGGVTAAQIEDIGRLPVRVYVATAAREPASLPSPGVGMRHYATQATVRLVESEAALRYTLALPEMRGAAVLLPTDWSLPEVSGAVRPWAHFDDGPGLAATLYEGLRALDKAGPTVILVPLPARSDGLFAALRDRLDKAARPR